MLDGQIMNIETASKLAYREQALAYINETLKEAYTTYNLTEESVAILLDIEEILLKGKTWKKN